MKPAKDEKKKILDALKDAAISAEILLRELPYYYYSGSIDDFKKLIETYTWGMRSGLIEFLKDMRSSKEEKAFACFEKVRIDILDRYDLDLDHVVGTWERSAKKALKRGKIKSDDEFRSVKEYIDQLLDTEGENEDTAQLISTLDTLLFEYETSK